MQGDVLQADEVGIDQSDDQVIDDAEVLDSDSDVPLLGLGLGETSQPKWQLRSDLKRRHCCLEPCLASLSQSRRWRCSNDAADVSPSVPVSPDRRQVCEVRQNHRNTKPLLETTGHRFTAVAEVKGSEEPCFALNTAGRKRRGNARCRARPKIVSKTTNVLGLRPPAHSRKSCRAGFSPVLRRSSRQPAKPLGVDEPKL